MRKNYKEKSLFTPENLLREARRQKSIPERRIPSVCVLDPDGDIVEYLLKNKRATLNPFWACYHTKLFDFKIGRNKIGILGCAVGSSFAVLVTEEMFVSGCELLISITSSGRINNLDSNARFLLIEKALRDEGTSGHYIEPSAYSNIGTRLLQKLRKNLATAQVPVDVGSSWTTDAPFRETRTAIEQAKAKLIDCVEMEAAALYAFAKAKNKHVVCLAHLTNTMAQDEGDFEKGAENGSISSLELIDFIIKSLRG
jgi:purine-nucleoside phosphorylase